MDDDVVKKLLEQIKDLNQTIKSCQILLTFAVIACVLAIVIMLLIIFKGQGQFTKDKITIGKFENNEAKEDKLNKKVSKLKRTIKDLKTKQS